MEALDEKGKSFNRARMLVLGVAYKRGVDDDQESPACKLMELLRDKEAVVAYNDLHIPVLQPTRKYSYTLRSDALEPETLAASGCVLLATDHTAYDYDFILKHALLIVDTRNTFVGKEAVRGKVFAA